MMSAIGPPALEEKDNAFRFRARVKITRFMASTV